MKTTLAAACLALFSLSRVGGATLDGELAGFADRFQAAQPSDQQQAIWKLDWEEHLATALARAKAERRPVLFIHVTNISGPSNFAAGHC